MGKVLTFSCLYTTKSADKEGQGKKRNDSGREDMELKRLIKLTGGQRYV